MGVARAPVRSTPVDRTDRFAFENRIGHVHCREADAAGWPLQQVIDEREIDFRVNCLPTLYGESMVLRVLDKGGLNLGLDQLGFMRRSRGIRAQCPNA